MSDDTEWTEDRRKIREAERAGALLALRSGIEYANAESIVDRILPPPPPLHTYGRELQHGEAWLNERRRSDGLWEIQDPRTGEWSKSRLTDNVVRQRAAEIPLTDAECDALLRESRVPLTAFHEGVRKADRDAIRAAYARVMRGEVRGE